MKNRLLDKNSVFASENRILMQMRDMFFCNVLLLIVVCGNIKETSCEI